jgi:murein DD-endopeptidase MepM/ murein hydrolase activator NlpD
MNSETYEHKFSLKLSPLNVFVTVGLLTILSFFLGVTLVAFTSLREYIPGYSDINVRKNALKAYLKTEELSQQLSQRDYYLQNIRNIIEGKVDTSSTTVKRDSNFVNTEISKYKSREDSLLRASIEAETAYNLFTNNDPSLKNTIAGYLFFPPATGIVNNKFDAVKEHFGIDIVSRESEPIKATLDGSVIFSGYTSENGYVIVLQHSNNLISAYKHNSILLKKQGDYVDAGDVIAIMGNTGELSTGPHLHFELWYNGIPLNPEEYIVF